MPASFSATGQTGQSVYRGGQWVNPITGQPHPNQQQMWNARLASRPAGHSMDRPHEHSVVSYTLPSIPKPPMPTVQPAKQWKKPPFSQLVKAKGGDQQANAAVQAYVRHARAQKQGGAQGQALQDRALFGAALPAVQSAYKTASRWRCPARRSGTVSFGGTTLLSGHARRSRSAAATQRW
jgi:hypothetical protein